MKKRKLQIFLPFSIICILGSGCVSKQTENNLADREEIIEQAERFTEHSLDLQDDKNAINTEEPEDERIADITVPETNMDHTGTEQPINPSEDINETTAEMTENIDSTSEEHCINGYQLVDGMSVPVNLKFRLVDIKKGEEAYSILLEEKADLEPPENGMEYILITLEVSYVSGDAETVYIMENMASLEEAKMYFALSDEEGNAIPLTEYLSDSIYNLAINKGESAEGSVAFLHRSDSRAPLQFVGFGRRMQFESVPFAHGAAFPSA